MLECNNADFPCNNFHAIFSLIGDCILCPSNHHSASVFMMYRNKFRTSLVETNHRNCGWVRLAVKNDTAILNLNLTFELYFKQLKMLEFKLFFCTSFLIMWIEAGRQNFRTTKDMDPRITQCAKHRAMINSSKLKLILI